MSCGPGADQFIEEHFKDCVYNVRDYIGFCLGLAAIAFWIIAQLPQYYRNYKTKSAEALSPWFLAQWLLGDTFNLIGALLQGQQLPTTVYTAMYFVIADMFMMMQFIYYGALQRRREQVLKLQARRRHHHHRRHHQHHHQQHDSGASREREALLGAGQQPHSSSSTPPAPAAASGAQQDQQQQQQGQQRQSPAWSSQQQERRRVSHQAAGQQQEQQDLGGEVLMLSPSAAATSSKHQLPEQQPQGWMHSAADTAAGRAADDSGSCSDSACSSSSEHSSSKQEKSLSRGFSPSRLPGATSCAAAAAAAGGPFSYGLRLPAGMHWGGVRSVIAVGVLVSMGLVSLLPASTTRGLLPVSLSSGAAGQGDSTAARAMQAGLQQQRQGSSIHLQPPLHLHQQQLGSPAGVTGSSSSSSSSSSRSSGWARQRRVGDGSDPQHEWSFIVGTGLGYVASILYLCSRCSQIHKNYSRKSSEGLAIVMFMMAVCANLCTGTSIILRTFTWVELKEQLPWIIGSLGTISLDMVILWQSRVYSRNAAAAGQHQQQEAADHHHHRHHHQLLLHTMVDMPDGAPAPRRRHAAVPGAEGSTEDRLPLVAGAAGDTA